MYLKSIIHYAASTLRHQKFDSCLDFKTAIGFLDSLRFNREKVQKLVSESKGGVLYFEVVHNLPWKKLKMK